MNTTFGELKVGDTFRTLGCEKEVIFQKITGPNRHTNCKYLTKSNTGIKPGTIGFQYNTEPVIKVDFVKPKTTTFADLPIGAFYKEIGKNGKYMGGDGIFQKRNNNSTGNCILVKEAKNCDITFNFFFVIETAKYCPVKRIKRVEN